MSFSTRNVISGSKDHESIEEDVGSNPNEFVGSKVVRKTRNTITSAISYVKNCENFETNENYESLTVKRANVDENEKRRNEKKTELEGERLTDSKGERSKTKMTGSRSMEMKHETVKTLVNAATQSDAPEFLMIPISSKSKGEKPSNVAVPRKSPPLWIPLSTIGERPLVLATHLVPSLPIGLFQVLVEAIEVAIERPVVLLYEHRIDRPVAKEIVDIAILPASDEWEDGQLLAVSFSFEHHLNKDSSPCVYADLIAATDRAPQDITALRGHRCSLPDRKRKIGAAALLFNYLYSKGEGPAFFGNTLDADTQLATLQMLAGKQAEVGIVESPVIKCHRNTLPGIDSLHILTSLGPLPPYRIMARKTLSDVLVSKITNYLLHIGEDSEWLDRFAPFGVTNFSKNSSKFYDFAGLKSIVTNVRYY